MGNKALAEKLVQGFLREARAQLSNLRSQLESRDTDGARRDAHTSGLRAVALETEQAVKAGEMDSVHHLLPRLEEQLARLRDVLAREGWTSG